MTQPPSTPTATLIQLLADALAPDDLRLVVLSLPDAPLWRADLPFEGVPRRQYAAQILTFLQDRAALTTAFFAALRAARPNRAAEITALEVDVLGPGSQDPVTDSTPLAALRAQTIAQANVLPGVFKTGGPAALSEITVELVLRDQGGTCDPDAPFRRAQRRGMELLPGQGRLRRHGSFPLRELLLEPHRRWIFLGEPGSGKTTTLRHFTLLVAKDPRCVPVLLCVSDLTEHGLSGWLERRVPGVSRFFFEAARQGRAVVAVDGLDEALDPIAAREALVALSSQLGDSLLIVTSRTVGYEQPSVDFGELLLCPLDRGQQEDLLQRWMPDRPAEALRAHLDSLARNPRMARLADNPLILTLIARLLRAPENHEALPARRSELYHDVIKILLTRGADPNSRARPFANAVAPRTALGWIALYSHGQDTDTLPVAALHQRFAEAPPAVRAALKGQDLDDFLLRVAGGAGLLEADATDLSQAECWSFAHRTFREYLAARALADEVVRVGGVQKAGLGSELDRRLSEARARPALWAEVFALLTGILPGGEAEALVRRLVEGGQEDKPLLFRVLADAEGLREETVWDVLGLASDRGEWERRSQVLQMLPTLVGDLGVAVKLLGVVRK